MPHHRVHIIELSPSGKFNLRRSPRRAEFATESPKQRSKLAPRGKGTWKRGYYSISGNGREEEREEEGFVFRAYPLFKEGKKGGGEKKDIQGETNRENYIYIGSWIGMKTPRIVA